MMAGTTHKTIRVKADAMAVIEKIQKLHNVDFTTAINKICELFKEYHEDIKFFFELFQSNASNLDIDENQKFQAMKILEVFQKNDTEE